MKRSFAVAFAMLLAACGRDAATPVFHADANPEKLSAWGVLHSDGTTLRLANRVMPYDLATPLFSDYALKLRTITLPEGAAARYDQDSVFDLPVGSIITKTFYYPLESGATPDAVAVGPDVTVANGEMPLSGLRLIETRVLAHREDGWVALPYVWNDDQTEAVLKRTGDVVPLTLHRTDGREEEFAYLVPNANQCAGCHATNNTTREIEPIGVKARHLNKPSTFAAGMNQLDHWLMTGVLEGVEPENEKPANAVWGDDAFSIDARARAYLDANCAHCHSDVGPADTSGLDLRPHVPLGPVVGYCKTPVAAGAGSGGRPYDIVPGAPDQSITVFRMETNDPGAMMPELGRAVAHEEGVALIREWIAGMSGACN